jgi:hypothetical protein
MPNAKVPATTCRPYTILKFYHARNPQFSGLFADIVKIMALISVI